MSYQPLPEFLYIGQSSIAGQGLFTNKDLNAGTELGMSHMLIKDSLIRTPLGGFINHSEDPNCEKYQIKHAYFVKVKKDIDKGQELTLKYEWYDPTKQSTVEEQA